MRMRLSQSIALFLSAVLAAIGISVSAAPIPNFKAQDAGYYAALQPKNVPKFDYAYYSTQDNQPVLLAHPEYAEEIVLRSFIKGVIAFAEGTYPNAKGLNPYQIIVGYSTFDDFSDHPRRYIKSANSDATGMPQFLSTTWDGLRQEFPNIWYSDQPAFGPKNQELGAALLLRRRGSYAPLMSSFTVDATGKIIPDVEKFTVAVNKSCQEWASFPCADGKGAYGQSYKSIEVLWSNFQKVLEEEQAGFVPVANAVEVVPEKETIVPEPEHIPTSPEELFPDGMKTPPVDGEIIGGYMVTDIRRFREKNPVTGAAGYNRWHDGFDFGIEVGVPLYSPMPGKAVCHLGDNSGFGNYVEFFPEGLDGRSFVFKHLNDCEDVVAKAPGELFGHTGNTGFGSGPHLHMAGWRYVGDKWEHYDYSKGWTVGFLTGKLPQKQ